jgi:hypothetical protein
VEDAIDPKTHRHAVIHRLEMDVAGARPDRPIEQAIDQVYDSRTCAWL